MVDLTRDILRQLPKVLLHDHLDGGLRPETIIELAHNEPDISLATEDPQKLQEWFLRGANCGSLSKYLEGFAITCGVMQTQENLKRVARELMEDMKDDNVVYVEVRFAPNLHTARGLDLNEVMSAVLAGLREGQEATGVEFGLIVCGMRNMQPASSLDMARIAVTYRDSGCLGFDLAGDESGNPPKDHLDAFHFCQRENFNITIHAGEAFGAASIWQALQYCGAHRIGHCTRLTEDMTIESNQVTGMGSLSRYILDKRIPLEVCLKSNIHTGAVSSFETHPFRHFVDGQFRVGINTDNRLMSDTSMTGEFEIAHREFGLDGAGLEKITMNAMKSSFLPHVERTRFIYDVLKPGYKRMREEGLI